MGDKNELYNIREEHIIRFHVSQGKEKKKANIFGRMF